jgi:hypothetical protein
MKVLITRRAGFIGPQLMDEVLDRDPSVRAPRPLSPQVYGPGAGLITRGGTFS